MIPSQLQKRNAQRHYEAAVDAGATYRSFRGWVLSCFACGHEARGGTKYEALRLLQSHYDAVGVGTDYHVTVLNSRGTS